MSPKTQGWRRGEKKRERKYFFFLTLLRETCISYQFWFVAPWEHDIQRWWACFCCLCFVIWFLSSFSAGCLCLLLFVFLFVCSSRLFVSWLVSSRQYSSSKFPSFYSPRIVKRSLRAKPLKSQLPSTLLRKTWMTSLIRQGGYLYNVSDAWRGQSCRNSWYYLFLNY